MKSIGRLPNCVLSRVPGVPANSALAGITLKARCAIARLASNMCCTALRLRSAGILLVACSVAFGLTAKAQTAHLSGYQLTTNINPTPASGYSPYAIAVDGSGNVFTVGISSNDSRQVTEWTPSGGTYTSTVVVSNLPASVGNLFSIAVDQSDNLYVGTTSALVKETLSGGTYAQSVIAENSGNNLTVAVDLNGNVYTAALAYYGAGITKYTPSAGGYQASAISVPSPTAGCYVGIDGPIAIDAAGNVYLGTNVHNGSCDGGKYLIEESPSLGGYTQTQATEVQQSYYLDGFVITDPNGKVYTITTPTMLVTGQYSTGSAVDASGNIYTTGGSSQGLIWKSTPYPASSSGGNFGEVGGTTGNVSFGSSSSGGPPIAAFESIAVSSIFTFDSAGTLGGITLASGSVGGPRVTDFAYVSGSCNYYTTYAAAAGQTCTVDLTFTPSAAGIRLGAVYLADSSHSVLATAYVQGTGVAPQAVLYPGTQSVIFNAASNGLSQPSGLAIDGVSNIFIADAANNQVVAQARSSQAQVVIANGPANGLSGPKGVAVDGSGSVLIADTGNNRVVKETGYLANGLCLTSSCPPPIYTQSVVAGGLSQPEGVAVDGAGFIYIADTGNNRILLETPAVTGYTQSVLVDTGLSNPTGIAVDGSGDLYIANSAGGEVVKETLNSGSYTLSVVASGLNQPQGVSLDPGGNVYIADAGNNRILLEQFTGSGYTQTVIAAGLNNPQAFLLNPNFSNGNTAGYGYDYIADTGNQRVLQLDVIGQQTVNFPTTPVGGASSAQTLTLVNNGNAPLQLTVPATGSNPSLVSDYGNTASAFTLTSDGAGDCPMVSAGAPETPTLAAGASCQMHVSFTPNALDPGFGNREGDVMYLVDNSLYNVYGNEPEHVVQLIGTAETAVGTTTTLGSSLNPSFSGQTVTFTATVSPASGVTVPTGTVQFSVDGSTVGLPATMGGGAASYSTSSLAAGTHSITSTYIPASGTAFTTSTSAALSQVVDSSTPTITWPTPAAISYGTALSATQLNATSTVGGIFVYSPAPGTVLPAGTQTLSVTFTPTDATDYTTVTATVELTVSKATPVINWPSPAPITYGTALSASQLDASSPVAGSFAYTPASGTVLAAGVQTLSVAFTPNDTADYTANTTTVQLTVNKLMPTISWSAPAAIEYGNALSSKQLNATSSVAGAFVYTPAAGTVLDSGLQTLSATFTPTDTTTYATTTSTVTLVVNPARLTVKARNASMTYGSGLPVFTYAVHGFVNGDTEATALSGAPALTTTASSQSSVGDYPITAATGTLTAANYTFNFRDGSLTIKQAELTAAATDVSIVFGSAVPTLTYTLSGFENGDTAATSTTGSPVLSTTATAGSSVGSYPIYLELGTLASTNYKFRAQNGTLKVSKATPSISWATPAAITYGTALGATQQNAASPIAGTFAYSPAAGTVLDAGTHTLSATFTPDDTADYTTVRSTVSLTVNAASQAITFTPLPNTVVYGTAPLALSATSTSSLTVKFSIVSGSAKVNGSTLTFTGAGTVVVAADQAGNNNYSAAPEVAQTIVVSQAEPGIVLTSSASSISAGSNVKLTATMSGSGANPTGTVTFFDGTTTLDTATLNANGVASYSTKTLAMGVHIITATYGGNTNYLTVTSTAVSVTVQ